MTPPPPPPPPPSSMTPDKRPQLTHRWQQLRNQVKREKQRLDQLKKETTEKETRLQYYQTQMATNQSQESMCFICYISYLNPSRLIFALQYHLRHHLKYLPLYQDHP